MKMHRPDLTLCLALLAVQVSCALGRNHFHEYFYSRLQRSLLASDYSSKTNAVDAMQGSSHHSPTESIFLRPAQSPASDRRLILNASLIALGLCVAFAVFGCCFVFLCCPQLRRKVVTGRVVGGPPAATVGLQLPQPQPADPASSQATDKLGTLPPSYDNAQRQSRFTCMSSNEFVSGP